MSKWSMNVRCFPCLKMEAEATFRTYRCFKIKVLNKVKKKEDYVIELYTIMRVM